MIALFRQRFALARRDRSDDGHGGWTERWVEFSTERGRIRPVSASEARLPAQLAERVTHVLYLRAGAGLQRGDRVSTRDGRFFDVMAVRIPSAGRHLQADCREVQQGQ